MRMLRKNIGPRNICSRLTLALLIVCVFSSISISGATLSPAVDLGQFPAVQATNLEKAKLRLPQELSGQMNLVIISFAREQQQQVDTWAAAARQLQPAHTHFSYYELLAMSSENLLYRLWFDGALRSNTADKDMRHRILTAYVNMHKLRTSLHIHNEKQVVAILVDRAGKLYWRADGACSSENQQAFQSALTANGL